MANFEIPFANTAPRRTPTADEKANGFPCGAADQTLFNGMFHRLEAEIGAVIAFAGLAGTDADYSQLRKAITGLIDAATGGGETESYLLLSQAASRLPIFPEIVSSDGRINLTSPAPGSIRVPGGVDFLHRGVALYTTAQTDIVTLASRTYHLRWSPSTGLALKLVTDPIYNPDGFPENNAIFDSKYDDMLIGRIITNSSNIATFTMLANKNKLRQQVAAAGAPYRYSMSGYYYLCDYNIPTNWSRTPDIVALFSHIYAAGTADITGGVVHGGANVITQQTYDRYGVFHQVATDWNNNVADHTSYIRGSLGA